ncbi:hypothetical protein RJ640_006206 [Escallonia rubra]|uniref:Uncharacterized protein n=1 Tax=Escallonia rubra TaxID=112253 RepID=A0AA88RUY1_9ASTE|nr:hypothetical protein RJ640_006206 [Escallonia rubra]
MRLVNVEALKMKMGTEGKEEIGYSELIEACKSMGVAKSTDEAAAFSRVLDEAGVVLQPWTKQITLRGVIASMFIGSIFSVIAMKLNLTTGLTPSLNVSAALLAFVFMRTWTNMLRKAGITSVPFTRHENTMIQTCSVASYSIAVAGGFGSYLLGLNKKTYEMTGVDTEGNSPGSYKEPGFGWMTTYLFLASFVGLFVLIPLRKIGGGGVVVVGGFRTLRWLWMVVLG